MDENYKYFAFISYNSNDIEWGKRLQRRLEHYRLPTTLCSEHGWSRTPIKPVFFAPADIQPGVLTQEIQDRLRASRHLIVICSPHSAQSEWVGREIAFFHEIGRTQYIHFFIVDGIPNSKNKDTECFNPIIHQLGLPEILGANIHEKVYDWAWLNKERAYVQLVSKLLDIEFDAIWQRHRRLLIQKLASWTMGVMMILASMSYIIIKSQPIDVQIALNERSCQNNHLPPLHQPIVTLALDNEIKTDTISNINTPLVFSNIPHRFLDKKVKVVCRAKDFIDIDTVVRLNRDIRLDIYRDSSVYGNVYFRLWSSTRAKGVGNTPIAIDGISAISDEDGYVSIYVPLKFQKRCYPLAADIELMKDTLYLPCRECDIVEIKEN